MSLQFEPAINQYAQSVIKMWQDWRTLTPQQRVDGLKTAIKSCVQFLPSLVIRTYNEADMGSYGYHMPADFSVNLNEHHGQFTNILFDDFIEWATTPYHESRHAEQTYRIAQGVLSGELELPRRGFAQQMQTMQGRSPSDIRNALQSGKPMEIDRTLRIRTLRDWLKVPMSVITHADTHRSYFDNYCKSDPGRPWYDKRVNPIKNAVIDWMKTSYDTQLSVIDRKAQANAGKSRGFGRMYQTLAEEKDAFGLEKYLQGKICKVLQKTRPQDGFHAPPGLSTWWKSKSARGILFTRSTSLVKVDNAVKKYDSQLTEANLAQLKTDFDNWYDHNSNDRHGRNYENCVEDLKKYIKDAGDYINNL